MLGDAYRAWSWRERVLQLQFWPWHTRFAEGSDTGLRRLLFCCYGKRLSIAHALGLL